MARTQWMVVLVTLALVESNAWAQSPAPYQYVAQTFAPAARTGAVTVGTLTWTCTGSACSISGPWPAPGVHACASLAAQVGRIGSYGRAGAMLTDAQLAQCNANVPSAQTLINSNLALHISPGLLPAVVLPHIDGVASAHTSSAHDNVSTAPDSPVETVAGLSMFNFSFENGDHKLRLLEVQDRTHKNDDQVGFGFSDSNGDDPFTASARWINFSTGQQAAAGGSGAGTITLPIPEGPRDTTFVLIGFALNRDPNTDANVRAITIAPPESGRSAITVTLVDNHGRDFRGNRSGPHYEVNVDYAWIPNSLIEDTGSITGSERGRDAARIPPGLAVIRGFSFNFSNGDHYLMIVGADTADGGVAHFQDNNLGTPMRWEIDYAYLRNPVINAH